jgi:ketosteroid isomerase-like protein
MTTIQLDRKLNDAILAGQALAAFEELYADDVVMQENSDPPFAGKALNRDREAAFFASIAEFHSAALLASAVNGDVSFSEWDWDLTFRNGARVRLNQVAVRRWRDGKVISERFYYNKA